MRHQETSERQLGVGTGGVVTVPAVFPSSEKGSTCPPAAQRKTCNHLDSLSPSPAA